MKLNPVFGGCESEGNKHNTIFANGGCRGEKAIYIGVFFGEWAFLSCAQSMNPGGGRLSIQCPK